MDCRWLNRPKACAKLLGLKQRRMSGCCRRSCDNVHQAHRLQPFYCRISGIGFLCPCLPQSLAHCGNRAVTRSMRTLTLAYGIATRAWPMSRCQTAPSPCLTKIPVTLPIAPGPCRVRASGKVSF
jgi:hypothetical protein